MKEFVEKLLAGIWNRFVSRRRKVSHHGLRLGFRVRDDSTTRSQFEVPQAKRTEHLAILGKTGQGKTSLIHHLAQQDIEAGRGFAAIDLHGDTTPFLLRAIAAEERRLGCDLSEKLIVVKPTDPLYSVGLNPLEGTAGHHRFVQVSGFAQILKQRWHLESFGARTDELLRNSLCAIAENDLTILELVPFLSHAEFRAACLKRVTNPEVRQYFELRYDQASEPMRTVMREPILNKTSAFTADPHFRHIVGQSKSTFSSIESLDQDRWILFALPKGQLGEQAVTLASVSFTAIAQAIFSRKSRRLFTLYCDELQNLVAYDTGIETVLSEARKFGVGVVSANQFLDQYPPEMRAAILAVGMHVFFQLSIPDAQLIATALDGGKPLAELLKNLPRRHMVVKSGGERWQEVLVPTINDPKTDYADLYDRSRKRWARRRDEIEQEISARQGIAQRTKEEALREWE
jgi:energy-coupling factor transporter ATP-binding protein EcfA2